MTIDHLEKLQDAYNNKKLTLYLGAGVSMGNGLPSWEQLVLAMYFSVISEQSMKGWRPFPNYLFAIAEWFLSRLNEPLEITGRKLQKYFDSADNGEEEFVTTLYETLYSGHLDERGKPGDLDQETLCNGNSTLDAVAALCRCSQENRGVNAVVTYNYDDFLEIAMGDYPYQSIYKENLAEPGRLPIYHVHGFVPIRKSEEASKVGDLVFTEYQYNKVAGDPEHWSNKAQFQLMSNSVGLMIGLSLSDRNMRRLLDTIKEGNSEVQNYALLKRPKEEIGNEDLDEIHEKAISFLDKFRNSGAEDNQDFSIGVMTMRQRAGKVRMAKKKSSSRISDPFESNISKPAIKSSFATKSSQPMAKKASVHEEGEPRYRYEIREIIRHVERLDREQQEFVMRQLGVKPIWYSDYSEIPEILNKIAQRDS